MGRLRAWHNETDACDLFWWDGENRTWIYSAQSDGFVFPSRPEIEEPYLDDLKKIFSEYARERLKNVSPEKFFNYELSFFASREVSSESLREYLSWLLYFRKISRSSITTRFKLFRAAWRFALSRGLTSQDVDFSFRYKEKMQYFAPSSRCAVRGKRLTILLDFMRGETATDEQEAKVVQAVN